MLEDQTEHLNNVEEYDGTDFSLQTMNLITTGGNETALDRDTNCRLNIAGTGETA